MGGNKGAIDVETLEGDRGSMKTSIDVARYRYYYYLGLKHTVTEE